MFGLKLKLASYKAWFLLCWDVMYTIWEKIFKKSFLKNCMESEVMDHVVNVFVVFSPGAILRR
jgi:hypothetical protein